MCCMSELIHEKGKGNHYSGGSSRCDKMRRSERDFPDRPVVKALRSHRHGLGSIQEKDKRWSKRASTALRTGPGMGRANRTIHTTWPLYETQDLVFSMHVHENLKA